VIKASANYKNHKLHGIKETFDHLGNKSSFTTFKNNRKSGDCAHYYQDANLKVKLTYFNDKIEGRSEVYHTDGTIQIRANYKKGNLDGIYEGFDIEGRKTKRLFYKNSLLEGKCIENVYYNEFSSPPLEAKGASRSEVISFFTKGDRISILFNYYDKENNKMFSKEFSSQKYENLQK
jgi:hypothetical protein